MRILKEKGSDRRNQLDVAQPRPSGHPTGSKRRLIENVFI